MFQVICDIIGELKFKVFFGKKTAFVKYYIVIPN